MPQGKPRASDTVLGVIIILAAVVVISFVIFVATHSGLELRAWIASLDYFITRQSEGVLFLAIAVILGIVFLGIVVAHALATVPTPSVSPSPPLAVPAQTVPSQITLQAKYCQYCGKEFPQGTSFCAFCGKPIAAQQITTTSTKFCQHCGAVIAFEAEICPKCGVRVKEPPQVTHPIRRTSRMPEFVLGLTGAILGLLFIPLMMFLAAFQQSFQGSTSLWNQSIVSGLMSVVGLVGAVFVRSKTKFSGVLLMISGIVGIIVALGFYVGGLLLLIAGILALVRKDDQGQ